MTNWKGHQTMAQFQFARRRATDLALPTGLFLVSRQDKAPELTREDMRGIIREQETQPTAGRLLLLAVFGVITWLIIYLIVR